MTRVFYKRYGLVAQSQRFVPVTCRTCGTQWQKRKTELKAWGGRCGPCAQKRVKADPKVRAAQAQRARMQVIAQGGIPNARKFTPGSTAGPKNGRWVADRAALKSSRPVTECRAWRQAVFARDDYTCQHCGERGGRLNADHIKPWSQFPDLRFDLSNGRTLCERCHRKTPTFGRRTNLYEAGRTAAMVA